MPEYSVKEALELRVKEFTTYMASFLSAMLIMRAIEATIKYYGGESLKVIWTVAISTLILGMSILVVMTVLDPSDKEKDE